MWIWNTKQVLGFFDWNSWLEFLILVHCDQTAVEYRRKSEDPREATVSKLVDIPFSSCFRLYIVPKALSLVHVIFFPLYRHTIVYCKDRTFTHPIMKMFGAIATRDVAISERRVLYWTNTFACRHGLRTSNEGINQRYLKNQADVADKICFCHT